MIVNPVPKKKLFGQALRGISVICVCIVLISVLMTLNQYYSSVEHSSQTSDPRFATGEENVLFISSYSATYMTFPEQQAGIDSVFYPNNVAYDILFMNAKEYGSAQAERNFYDQMKNHVKSGKQYDAILLGDDDALEFAMKYRKEFFEGIPMVFFGINDFDRARSALKFDKVTGSIEQEYIKETIEEARYLLPNARKVVGIFDETPTGIGVAKSFWECKASFPEMEFQGINTSKHSREELEQTISDLNDDTILLFMIMTSDKDGNKYIVPDATDFVLKYANIPVFRNYNGGMGTGIIGGVRMDMQRAATQAADTVVDILEGTDPNSIKPTDEKMSRTIFDYKVLQKYHLSMKQLPVNCEFVNKPINYMSRNKEIIIPAIFLFFAILSLFIDERMRLIESRKNEEQLRIITEHLEDSRRNLQYQVQHDNLTQLYNRQTAVAYLRYHLQPEKKYAMVLIDIDNFKEINETYGHRFGDEVLVTIAHKLKDFAKWEECYIARYGGDEFLLVFENEHLYAGNRKLQKLTALFQTGIKIGMEYIIPNASFGIANSDESSSSEELILDSDMAMYEAKKKGKNMYAFYTQDMKNQITEINRIKAVLVDAIANEKFYMLYQPQIDAQTGKVSGYEALVRMEGTKISPGVFIPIAEQNGWIRMIGRITTKKVVEQLAEWKRAGKQIHPVAINFSSNQINDTEYLEYLLRLLQENDISSEYIEIEITENLVVEKTQIALDLFTKFKEAGIQLHMDDFGTGYSSLSYLSYLPIDTIKLDKSLVDTYLQSGKEAFIEDVICLGHDLGKKLIIEGVEEEWQYKKLKEFQADIIQGYYFSKPLPPEEAIDFTAIRNN